MSAQEQVFWEVMWYIGAIISVVSILVVLDRIAKALERISSTLIKRRS